MSSLHFIGGEKGGVGKSFTARLLAQYYIDKQVPFIGYDSDQSHSTFSRFYSEYTAPVDTSSFDSLDRIIELAEQNLEQNIIVDLAAQTASQLNKWLQESEILDIFTELGFTVYVWHVMDDGADSLFLLGKTLENFSNAFVQFVLVENLGRGENFDMTERSETFANAKARDSHTLTLSKLQTSLVKKIDFSDSSFWAAANNSDLMSTVERHRVRAWLNKHYLQIDSILFDEKAPLAEPMFEM
jgi:hypothetical protein